MKKPSLATRYGNWRHLIIFGLMGLAGIVFVIRLFDLQIINWASAQAQVVENYTKTISLAPPRGIIYDRRGYILARNIASYNIVITPASLPDDLADIQGIY